VGTRYQQLSRTIAHIRERAISAHMRAVGGHILGAVVRRLGQTFARFVGLVMTILGVWVFAINLIEDSYTGGTLRWILASGGLGAVGGVLYLLSFDGPDWVRTRWIRVSGWIGMLALAVLPWSFTFLVLPMFALTVPTLFWQPEMGREEVVRGGSVFTVIRDGNETRVIRDIGNQVRVEVVSRSADAETLLSIAEDISRETTRNQ
jgi:hypothetical protein